MSQTEKWVKKVALLIQFFSVESESSAGCVCFQVETQVMAERAAAAAESRGPAQSVTVKGTQQGEEERRKEGGVRRGPRVRIHSEYGGLVLSADSALGFLLVHQPCGAAL